MTDPRPILQGVSETLLIPLAARALLARRSPETFSDPLSSSFLADLGETPDRFENDRWNMAGAAARTLILDQALVNILRHHPSALVINLGAGLCSRYWRLGPPTGVRWVDIDLPSVIELKRELIRNSESEGLIPPGKWEAVPADVTEFSWSAQVLRKDHESVVVIAEGILMYLSESQVRELLNRLVQNYPGANMLLETWSPFVSRVWGRLSGRIRRTGTRVRWGLAHPRQLTRWNPRIKVLNSWSPGDINPRDWGLLRYAPRLRRSLMKIHELQFVEVEQGSSAEVH